MLSRIMKSMILAALVLLTGCVTSRQARHVTPSAFLGEAQPLLAKGTMDGDPLLVYHRAATDWTVYDKMLVEPVEVRRTTGAASEDDTRLANSFDRTLRTKLGASYAMVDAAQPGALRLQVALIDGAEANAPLKVVKAVAPYAGVADFLWTFATGKPAFAGEVSLEYMIRDAASGELLAAGADRRVGGNQLGAATFTRWGDVQNILTYWADLAAYRLCVDRRASDCRKPSAGVLEP